MSNYYHINCRLFDGTFACPFPKMLWLSRQHYACPYCEVIIQPDNLKPLYGEDDGVFYYDTLKNGQQVEIAKEVTL